MAILLPLISCADRNSGHSVAPAKTKLFEQPRNALQKAKDVKNRLDTTARKPQKNYN